MMLYLIFKNCQLTLVALFSDCIHCSLLGLAYHIVCFTKTLIYTGELNVV